MPASISLTVNGDTHRLSPSSDRSLLAFLREDLGLTGAKNGCDGSGACGACTVLVDGQAKKSCRLQLSELDGAEILTIEGLSADGSHPVQQAFISCGAVQCGFCTPGMVLASVALLARSPAPTREDVLRGLNGNLCRCTGYVKIVDAVQQAARILAGDKTERIDDAGESSLPRPDAFGKVTGRARYADDLRSPDDLVLRVVWAEHAHALLKAIRTEDAKRIEGVVDILTADDVPGTNAYGLIHRNQPVLCRDRVRFLGDPVALVIAEDERAAERAVERIELAWEQLPEIRRPEMALDPDAVRIHEEGNVCCEYRVDHGDVDAAFTDAHLCVSGRFETPAVEHAYLDPEAGIAEWDDDTLVVHAASQYPQAIQEQLADLFDLPRDRIRVISPTVGGAFGGKTDISVQALVALAAWHTKRRVRLTWRREESLRASVKRHPMIMDYHLALDADGRLLGVKADLIANAGAYESLSHPLLEQTAAFAAGPYFVPAIAVRVRGVYTNTPTSSAFRGFGIPQPTFAMESLLDEAARSLALSPFDVRRKNALRPGDRSATGQIVGNDTHIVEALDALAESYAELEESKGVDEGVGVACGYKNIGLGLGESDHASATVVARPDGRLIVKAGAVDVGQGSETILAQLAAERLGLLPSDVRVEWGDTAFTPDGRETNASRQTVVSGNAVVQAVDRLWEELVQSSGEKLSSETARREIWKRLCAGLDAPYEVAVCYQAPDTVPLRSWDDRGAPPVNYFTYTFFANLAHVRVDASTGRTRVLKLVSSYDVGRVIHRQAAEGQIEGGAVMGMGFALSESFDADRTQTLADCGIPRASSLPDVEARFVETEDSIGPHGCKGIGEVSMIAVAPSITNAIRDAIGIRVYELPANAANLRKRLEEGGERAA